MKHKRRSFTPEFKREAATLVIEQNYTISDVSKVMDVSESAMQRWVKQLKNELRGIKPAPGSNAITTEQRHIQERGKE